jgi:hypothetical protein
MHIQIVPEDEHEQFRNLSQTAKSIASRAKMFLETLAKADPQESLLGAAGIVVSALEVVGEQGQIAAVETPIGKGRVTLSYGMDDGKLVGCLVFSRMRFDHHDVATWEPSFTIFVPSKDNVYGKTGKGNFVVSLQKRFDQPFSDSLYDVMLAIIASMIPTSAV